jgi:hypothetical protein
MNRLLARFSAGSDDLQVHFSFLSSMTAMDVTQI